MVRQLICVVSGAFLLVFLFLIVFPPPFVPCGLFKAWLISLVLLTALYPRLDKLSYGISVNGLVAGVFPIFRVYSQEQGLCH
jgi:hypothetical protein